MRADPDRKTGAWSRALELAGRTPPSRNRYVDLLRALSIGAVVTGHWLIAAPWAEGGELRLDHLLRILPWTRWLTWLLQVMPIFFMVGGYSNAASWEAARREGGRYGEWLGARLERLMGPVVPLLLVWFASAAVAGVSGVSDEITRLASQAALVPVWFLAVYMLAILLVPATHALWQRYGLASFWALSALAVVVDLLAFQGGLEALRWTNYGFIWLAVHQLGYFWRDGGFDSPLRALPWAAGGLALLLLLVTAGGYPLSMVGVPGEEVSNTLPPTIAMLALGCAQAGLLLSLERPARRWLSGSRAWAATILVNGTIMTVYLWHLSAMILLIALLHAAGDLGLHLVPGSAAWWISRPLWMVLLLALLPLFLLLFTRFERRPSATPRDFPAWRGVAGALLFGTGLALLALGGIAAKGLLGFRWGAVLVAVVGATIAGAVRWRAAGGPAKARVLR